MICIKCQEGRCCFMDKEITVVCSENKLNENKEFIFNIQKAMLATLFESGKIDMRQYENAVRLLEKKFSKS